MTVSSNGVATEEICCPKCGYNLFGLPEFRCPECGTPFDPVDIAARTHLLPWERPELGGRLRRLSRTILLASLHPGRYFSAINQRKDRSVENAGSLIKACIFASIFFYVFAFLMERIIFFLKLTWKYGLSQKILHSTFSLLSYLVSSAWFIPSLLILSSFLSILLIAILMARVFRTRTGALRDMDLAAILSPAIVSGTLISALCQVVSTIHSGIMGLFDVMVYGPWVVLLLLVWHCCRKLLALSRLKTAAMLVACGFVQYGVGHAVAYVLASLQLAILL